ncbi:MAG: thiamine pyrophosphate-dependent enzyme [Eubacteriaceae bacterium]|jgi:pyruvate/2-oxoacid:ferredoxin oxidoreductase beta subunit|nr:thiamine pyrophosphate-dependent enzyme [Eubacteriaceae bacterium]
MSYIDVLREAEDQVTPGASACQGCGGELILRTVLQIAGKNTILGVPPGCMAGAGSVGWNFNSGVRIPVTIPLLDNCASLFTGISQMYQRKGREDVNAVIVAGDGATADCGFQSLSGAAERNEKILYVCYDNEGYMNTGYQRSSTTTKGSRTSTTPLGSVINGKVQHQKYVPLILSMHGLEYCATASPSDMKDFVEKVQKGLAASKKGFAYLHVFSPCPTGWGYASDQCIAVARKAVKSNMFPLWEKDENGYKINKVIKDPMPIREFVQGISKFKKLTDEQIDSIQQMVDTRYAELERLAGKE